MTQEKPSHRSPELPSAPTSSATSEGIAAGVRRLVREHGNVAQLLLVLEAQLEILSVGEPCDLELVSEVLHYLVNFHDRFHHPREKAASLHVAARVVSARSALAAIARQHAELEARGAALLLAIDGPAIEPEPMRRALGVDGFAYVALLRAHMLAEESSLFPLVERTLTDDEWAAIVARVGASIDPLWGASDHAGYAALYERLTKSAGCGCAYD